MENSDTQIVHSQHFEASVTQTITSPLPLASEIKGYEQILPGSADRILSMVEKESEHRREMERRALELEGRDSALSLKITFAVALLLIASIVGLVLGGYTQGAGILAGSSIISVAVANIFKLRKNDKPPDND